MQHLNPTFMMVPTAPQPGVAPSASAGKGAVDFATFLTAQQTNIANGAQVTPQQDELAQLGLEFLASLSSDTASFDAADGTSDINLVAGQFITAPNTQQNQTVFDAIVQQLSSSTPDINNLPKEAKAALAQLGQTLIQGATIAPGGQNAPALHNIANNNTNPPHLLQQPATNPSPVLQNTNELQLLINKLQNASQQNGTTTIDAKQLQDLVQTALRAAGPAQNSTQPTITSEQLMVQHTAQHTAPKTQADITQNGQLTQSVNTGQATQTSLLAAQAATPLGLTPQQQATPGLDLGATITTSDTTPLNANIQNAALTNAAPSQANNLPTQFSATQIGIQIAKEFLNGKSRFEIRIDPPEMGRVDVRMDVDRNGQVAARLVVERIETLDALQRDARALEKALQQAGLDMDSTNLSFSLKDQQDQQQSEFESFAQHQDADSNANDSGLESDAQQLHQVAQYALTLGPGQIDIRV